MFCYTRCVVDWRSCCVFITKVKKIFGKSHEEDCDCKLSLNLNLFLSYVTVGTIIALSKFFLTTLVQLFVNTFFTGERERERPVGEEGKERENGG